MHGFQVVLEKEREGLFQRFCKHWLRLKWEWSLCGWLHWYDGLSNDDEWCVKQRVESRASIADLDDLQELRCLFVREGWSEYFLGLWCHSCSRMHQEDTHWRDWACLNIIHSGWESLSRVMWRGLRNVPLFSPLVASKVSLGKSSQSIHLTRITSHYQCAWTTILEFECIFTQLNGSQFRQV